MTATYGILQALGALFFKGRTSSKLGAADTEGAESATSPRCTVLAIDDDTAHLKAVRSLMEKAGFSVLTAASGAKGLDILRYAADEIRIVLLDYNMPRLDGAETLRNIRKLKPRVKVVGMTEEGLEALPVSFRNGVDSFLKKPLENETILSIVKSLLGVGYSPSI
jgi:two-component system cell cycle sensor histidine kinase/response regulator CckA